MTHNTHTDKQNGSAQKPRHGIERQYYSVVSSFIPLCLHKFNYHTNIDYIRSLDREAKHFKMSLHILTMIYLLVLPSEIDCNSYFILILILKKKERKHGGPVLWVVAFKEEKAAQT